MNRTEKMNQIRKHCGIKQDVATEKRSFFYREEFVCIAQHILGRKLSENEIIRPINGLIALVFPKWNNQTTAHSHPSLANIDYMLSLVDKKSKKVKANANRKVKDVVKAEFKLHTVSNEGSVALAIQPSEEPTKTFSLIDFVLLALEPSFSNNIKAISLDPQNNKRFTIELK